MNHAALPAPMSPRRRALELAGLGYSDAEAADAVGVSSRTVRRWRTHAGQASTYTPTPPAHGTRSRYVRGCRCEACRRANATYRAQTRAAIRRARRLRGDAPSV